MIPVGPDLKDLLVTLYGSRDWLQRGAEEIGVTKRTLRGWVLREYAPTVRHCARIKRAIARQQDRIAQFADLCGL